MKNNNKLGNNIKTLRILYGETPEQLANSLGVGVTTIYQYESGERKNPQKEILNKIASHFMVTVDSLLNEDLTVISDINFFNIPIHDKNYQKRCYEIIFPAVCTESAMKNKNFKKAYENYTNIEILDNDISMLLEKQIVCNKLYNKAYEEGVEEAIVNDLRFNMAFKFLLTLFTPKLINEIEHLNEKDITMKHLFNGILPNFDEVDLDNENYINYIEKYIVSDAKSMLEQIALLKKSIKYRELGDYYLALAYCYNLIGNGEQAVINNQVGLELMFCFEKMGNVYAKKYIENIINSLKE